MKKISLYFAMVGAVTGMVSCSQDRDPIYEPPTHFELNIPAMQDQLIELAEGNTLELTCSQPDYEFAAAATYGAKMSLTQDFADSYDLSPLNDRQAAMQVKQEDVASGYCKLLGLSSEEDYQTQFPGGFQPTRIYFRATCQIAGVESSYIESNVVSYNYIQPYFSVAVPGYIYLVGQPTNWTEPNANYAATYADWRLFEADDAIGSKIYSGVFDIPATEYKEDGSAVNWPMFRFYSALTGWDQDSYGYQEPDEAVQFPDAFADGTFTSTLVKGKGSFWFPNWEGGKMTIVVDMSNPNNMTVTMTAGEAEVVLPKYIYPVGNQFGGWAGPTESNIDTLNPYRLTSTDGGHIYTATVPVKAGDLNFKIYKALTDWDGGDAIGSQQEDGDVDFQLTNGMYSGPFVDGKGNWHFNLEADGNFSMTVDMDNMTVTYVLE